jgi:hypothetical protein
MRYHSSSRLFGLTSLLAVGALLLQPAIAQSPSAKKRPRPVPRAGGPAAVSQDFGDVAVVVDNGLIVTHRNAIDLDGRDIHFVPAGGNAFTVTSAAGALDPAFGPALTFGFPAASEWPGDDDTQQVAFPAGFPFLGTTYSSVWVNIDGNVTLGAPEFASDDRDKSKQLLGPPRISALLYDVNPDNAFNTDPNRRGSIHAVVKTAPQRLVVTWNGVADWLGGVSSTFQITLYTTGVVRITIGTIDPAVTEGVTGIAAGNGSAPIHQIDVSTGSTQALPAGAIVEAFAPYTRVSDVQLAREFYRSHADTFDFLVTFADFNTDGFWHAGIARNDTHGIGAQLDPATGEPSGPTIVDDTAAYGSGGELECVVHMNNVMMYANHAAGLVAPPLDAYRPTSNVINRPDLFGWPTTFDGQTTPQVRVFGTLPNDGGELSRHYDRGGAFANWIMSPMAILAHEVAHRWGASLRFVHPTKGVGFESYDLLGRDVQHWSWFVNTATPPGAFPGAPRFSALEGNHILDLGPLSTWAGNPTNLQPGERVFWIPADQLCDGYSMLDLHVMGLARANEVPPFFYVDEPRSVFTGQSLDASTPANPLDTAVTMRGWAARGDVVFCGKRVDLTVANVQAYERQREGNQNPQGGRFWGPKGNLKVRYSTATRRVEPTGDAEITLSTDDRELGDEADAILPGGVPLDVKTMAFVLLVDSGAPASHGAAIGMVDLFRQTWQLYGNGPATNGRGTFDTRLQPVIH